MAIEIVPRRTYQQRDRRYITEYVTLGYPGKPQFFNLRLGAAAPELARQYPGVNIDRLSRVWRKTADAVVVNEGEFVLLEGELRRPVESVGELLVYKDLVYSTPELVPYGRLPIRLVLVCPQDDPSVADVVSRAGIQIVIYQPRWAMDYLKEVNG